MITFIAIFIGVFDSLGASYGEAKYTPLRVWLIALLEMLLEMAFMFVLVKF